MSTSLQQPLPSKQLVSSSDKIVHESSQNYTHATELTISFNEMTVMTEEGMIVTLTLTINSGVLMGPPYLMVTDGTTSNSKF